MQVGTTYTVNGTNKSLAYISAESKMTSLRSGGILTSSHKQAQANQTNIVIMNRNRTWMIDVTVPNDSNIE